VPDQYDKKLFLRPVQKEEIKKHTQATALLLQRMAGTKKNGGLYFFPADDSSLLPFDVFGIVSPRGFVGNKKLGERLMVFRIFLDAAFFLIGTIESPVTTYPTIIANIIRT
jgi:hypothetical protein